MFYFRLINSITIKAVHHICTEESPFWNCVPIKFAKRQFFVFQMFCPTTICSQTIYWYYLHKNKIFPKHTYQELLLLKNILHNISHSHEPYCFNFCCISCLFYVCQMPEQYSGIATAAIKISLYTQPKSRNDNKIVFRWELATKIFFYHLTPEGS